jgi:hypothetical protein
MKDLRSIERRTFCYIEIPIIAHKDDITRYNEIYEMMRKIKGNRWVEII